MKKIEAIDRFKKGINCKENKVRKDCFVNQHQKDILIVNDDKGMMIIQSDQKTAQLIIYGKAPAIPVIVDITIDEFNELKELYVK